MKYIVAFFLYMITGLLAGHPNTYAAPGYKNSHTFIHCTKRAEHTGKAFRHQPTRLPRIHEDNSTIIDDDDEEDDVVRKLIVQTRGCISFFDTSDLICLFQNLKEQLPLSPHLLYTELDRNIALRTLRI